MPIRGETKRAPNPDSIFARQADDQLLAAVAADPRETLAMFDAVAWVFAHFRGSIGTLRGRSEGESAEVAEVLTRLADRAEEIAGRLAW